MLPLGTPVLVTWPGFPPLRAKVIGSGYDGDRPVYQVVSACGCAVWADEIALVDLRPFAGMPAAAFASELLAPAGLGGVERVAVADADPRGMASDLVAAAHDLLERLRDGKFCHVDRAETAPKLLELSRGIEAQARAMGAQ